MRNKNHLIIFLFVFALAANVQAQLLEVKLKKADTSAAKIPARPSADTAAMAHLPIKKYHHWSLRRIAYYNLQAMYENLPDDAAKKKSFREFVNRYELDTSYLTKQKIPGNYIYLFTAIDDAGNKHVIIDANNDHDFNDEHEYVFNKEDRNMPVFKANITYYDGTHIRPAVVILRLDAFNTPFPDNYYKTDIDKKLDVMINILNINRTGNITINKQTFKINITNYDDLHPKSSFEINVQKLPFDKKNNNDYGYKSSDTVEIGGNRYKPVMLSDNMLVLNFIEKTDSFGAETGTFAPAIASTDINTGVPFTLAAQKGKYLLFDFWGSWCVPCIRLIPEMKKLNEKYKNEIQFVSVAYDKPGDLNKVKKLIGENGMDWIQLFDDKDKKNGITNRYKVDEFPTCLLIDPAGKIIFRGVSGNGLQSLVEFFNKNKTKQWSK